MKETPPRILIVDDEEGMRDSVRVLLAQHGYDCVAAEDGERGLSAVETQGPFDAILCDLRMPGIDGLEFVDRLAAARNDTPIVMMSAYGTIELAVEAMRRGAFSFISKPFKPGELIVVLAKALAHEELLDENRRLREEVLHRHRFEDMIGRDAGMLDVFESVRKIAPHKTSVLIGGESGTGKELVARSIHSLSGRAGKRFVAVNCGAIPENLLESELFGHVRGAFTDAHSDKKGLFIEADGGTLFLDEISEMPMHLQVKLLRALQEEEIRPVGGTRPIHTDVRIVTASQQDLESQIRERAFREDLYYRLSVFPIYIPPLRDRPSDIPLLTEHFLHLNHQRMGIRTHGIRQKALSMLMEYAWPGNVRELENVIERAVVLSGGRPVEPDHLPDKVRGRVSQEPSAPAEMPVTSGDLSVKRNARVMEEMVIRKALEKTRGNRTAAARLLDISHRTLLYKMQEYGIKD